MQPNYIARSFDLEGKIFPSHSSIVGQERYAVYKPQENCANNPSEEFDCACFAHRGSPFYTPMFTCQIGLQKHIQQIRTEMKVLSMLPFMQR